MLTPQHLDWKNFAVRNEPIAFNNYSKLCLQMLRKIPHSTILKTARNAYHKFIVVFPKAAVHHWPKKNVIVVGQSCENFKSFRFPIRSRLKMAAQCNLEWPLQSILCSNTQFHWLLTRWPYSSYNLIGVT